jgi:hypothetical protein
MLLDVVPAIDSPVDSHSGGNIGKLTFVALARVLMQSPCKITWPSYKNPTRTRWWPTC